MSYRRIIRFKLITGPFACGQNPCYNVSVVTEEVSTTKDIIEDFLRSGITMKVKFKKEYPDAIIPDKDTSQSACVNLYAYIIDPKHRGEGITINPHKCYQFGSGISVEIPEGYVGLLLAKGNYGIMRQLSPANSAGVIDPDYRGEVMIGLENGGNTKQVVRHGDKVAQLCIVPALQFDMEEAETLSETERGRRNYRYRF